jgi:hypothetical protein
MAYTTEEGREELLDGLADAIEDIAVALAALGAAYELLDEHTADVLEEKLFGPVQVAFGRAKRTYSQFVDRTGQADNRTFEPAVPGVPSTGARAFIDAAVSAAAQADGALASLQDSMLPVEVGDPELRAGLTEVREHLGGLGQRARELERTLGR